MSGFGGAGFVGAGSGSDGGRHDLPRGGGTSGGRASGNGSSAGDASDDGASGGENADGGPRIDDGPRTFECMVSDVRGLCLLNEDSSSSFKSQRPPK
jgi:hypothetical protein